jgi:probable rRNA maturation factor
MGTVTVSHTVRTPLHIRGVEDIVHNILGKRYSLSIVFIGDKRAKRLNKAYRGKDTPADILTFPLTDIEGEIFINTAKVKRKAKTYGFTPQKYATFLLIHGCLHLKGYTHGSTMEGAEDTYIEKYNLR